jgi:hypothetical protein
MWSANPPAGGEHLCDALWTIERDENATVVSITEVPIRAVGYIVEVGQIGAEIRVINFVPAGLVTEEEVAAGPSNALGGPVRSESGWKPDPRVSAYYMSPNATITVFTLGDGGEQNITADEFQTIWSANPPAGDLANALWTIERDENAEVVSITEMTS